MVVSESSHPASQQPAFNDHPPLPTALGYEAIIKKRFHVLMSSQPIETSMDTREGFLSFPPMQCFFFLPASRRLFGTRRVTEKQKRNDVPCKISGDPKRPYSGCSIFYLQRFFGECSQRRLFYPSMSMLCFADPRWPP
ncbi:hypothetical protein FPOAC1_009406 [Fusarium poae]|uniref:hypothetical protein n=1 Tax=Fusarium poae TaxID=36050 RepID=UPI001CE8254A|nr:hypothetical protein FPOAC1_009406 [Fusarium poae]KAG8670003.1 hypothetical protein FPOAC1_009406 [Fusarium poae]